MKTSRHDQPTDETMDTDQASHLVIMTAKNGKKFWRVAIIRERLGAILHGGPLKPFSKGIKGFKTFCKTTFKGSALRKSELESLNNLGVSTASPNEIPIFTTPPEQHLTDEPGADEHTAHPKVSSAQQTETPALAEVVSKDGNDITKEITTVAVECTLPAEAAPALTTESPLEISEVQNSVDTEETASQEEAVACAEVVAEAAEPVSPSLDANPDAVAEPTPAPEAYNIIDTVIDTTSLSPVAEIKAPEVPTIVYTEPIAIERTLDTDIQSTPEPVTTASSEEDAILNTEVTSLDKEGLAIQEISPAANIDHVATLVEESEGDDIAVVPEAVDNGDDLESGIDTESEADDGLNKSFGIHVAPDIAHKNEEPITIPIPVTVHPVFYEDDFDPAVSSICGAAKLDELLGSDGRWFIPRIVEKAKLNRHMVQEGLANHRAAQGHYRNLKLEDAARNLVLDISAPVRAIKTTAAPAVIKKTEAPTIKEVETPATPRTPITQEVGASNKARAAEPIPMAIGLSSRTHSRSSSGSSADSADASLQSVACPDTPLTEYSVTPSKDEGETTK